MRLLQKAYFSNTTSTDAIRRSNIALWSDIGFAYGIVKAASLQANANNRGQNPNQRKNTFLFRYG